MVTGKLLARQQRGFTLLELMVVLVIIGLSVSLAALNVPGAASSQARQLGQKLTLATRLAQSQALAGGHIVALELQRRGYRFLRYQPGDQSSWLPFDEPELLRGGQFDADWHWRLNVDEELPVSEIPRLYFWPDGTLSPFSLELRDKQQLQPVLWTLSGSLLTLQWQRGVAVRSGAG